MVQAPSAAAAPVFNTGVAGYPMNLNAPYVPDAAPEPDRGPGIGEGDFSRDPCQFYLNADYLLWHVNKGSVPLEASGTPVGILGPINTGGSAPTNQFVPVSISNSTGISSSVGDHNGFRLALGGWLDPTNHDFGFEVGGFYLEKLTTQTGTVFSNNGSGNSQFIVNSGFSIITAVAGTPVAIPLVLTGQTTGSVSGEFSSGLWELEANTRMTWLSFGSARFGFEAGLRYQHFGEYFNLANQYSVTFTNTNGLAIGTVLPQTFTASTSDSISTTNNFYGAQVGADGEAYFGQFFINGRARVALGANRESVDIYSYSLAPAVTQGGSVFGQFDNGNHERTRISVIPDGTIRMGYQFCHYCRAYVGYDVMYMYNVVRPGDQVTSTGGIQVNVNGSGSTTNVNQLGFRFNDANMWVQGFDFGIEFRY